jgi:hypothetical protein
MHSNIPKFLAILGLVWLIGSCFFSYLYAEACGSKRITIIKGQSTIVRFFSFFDFFRWIDINVTLYYCGSYYDDKGYYHQLIDDWVIVVQQVGTDRFRRADRYDPNWYDKIKEEGGKFAIGYLIFKPVQRLDDGYIFDVEYNSFVLD